MRVPLHHPFWKVNLSLGNDVWAGDWDRSVTPQAPTPEFQANLVSIEAWVDEQPIDPFTCAYCDQTFNSAGQLVEHSRRCSQSIQDEQEAPSLDPADKLYWEFRCDECGKRLSNIHNLVRHKGFHAGVKPYQCLECPSAFATADQLKSHVRTHTKERPYKCNVCGKRFARNFLASHMRSHTKVKPYKCDYAGCHKSFARSGGLASHKKTHRGDRPYKCDKCNKAFGWLTTLKRHKASQHSASRGVHECDECKKIFMSKGSLKRHQKEHKADKPHKCDGCDAAFARKDKLDRHKKRKH